MARKKFVDLCTNAILMERKLDLFESSPYSAWAVQTDGLRPTTSRSNVSRRSKQHAPDNGPEEKIDDDELAEWIADAGPWADSSHHQAPMIGSTQIIRLSEIGRK